MLTNKRPSPYYIGYETIRSFKKLFSKKICHLWGKCYFAAVGTYGGLSSEDQKCKKKVEICFIQVNKSINFQLMIVH